ncbi:hypothetical protein [Myxosarcina sp. GI1]|uniref:hypothetical protein n=1 Tax=Myxosarcina sp. GI1 TaxID=1541065 RepID=UPI00055F0A26|nr:hypothetical protein [Myxosarcina sp. GI1]
MLFRRQDPDYQKFQSSICIRCDEFIQDTENGIKDNKKLANIWGIIHILLGLATVVLSSITTAITFYDQSDSIVLIPLLATVSAACLTFLNPSRREFKRRTAYIKFKNLNNRFKDLKLGVENSKLSKEDMLDRLANLSERYEIITEDLKPSVD